MARPSPSVSDRPMASLTQPPEVGMRLHAIGILRRRDRLGRGPRKHVPSTPAACKSRVASSEDAILLFARVCDGQVRQSLADARARARSRRTAVFFSLGKCNRLVLHQKLQNSGSLVDKKCEIGLKKTRHVRSNLPEARKSVSVLARKHRVQRRRRVYGANFHQSVRRAANARVRVIGRVVRA